MCMCLCMCAKCMGACVHECLCAHASICACVCTYVCLHMMYLYIPCKVPRQQAAPPRGADWWPSGPHCKLHSKHQTAITHHHATGIQKNTGMCTSVHVHTLTNLYTLKRNTTATHPYLPSLRWFVPALVFLRNITVTQETRDLHLKVLHHCIWGPPVHPNTVAWKHNTEGRVCYRWADL